MAKNIDSSLFEEIFDIICNIDRLEVSAVPGIEINRLYINIKTPLTIIRSFLQRKIMVMQQSE